MAKEHLFTEESKKGLLGMSVTDVGTDSITLNGEVTIYIDDNNEIKFINQTFNPNKDDKE